MAVEFLENNEIKVIERNFSCKFGEVDIIALKNKQLKIIEVKYRRNNEFGWAAESVGKTKINKMFKVANYYIYCNPKYLEYEISFDIIAVDGKEITYIENCYGAM